MAEEVKIHPSWTVPIKALSVREYNAMMRGEFDPFEQVSPGEPARCGLPSQAYVPFAFQRLLKHLALPAVPARSELPPETEDY